MQLPATFTPNRNVAKRVEYMGESKRSIGESTEQNVDTFFKKKKKKSPKRNLFQEGKKRGRKGFEVYYVG